jgi:Methane oxygenase PmoA
MPKAMRSSVGAFRGFVLCAFVAAGGACAKKTATLSAAPSSPSPPPMAQAEIATVKLVRDDAQQRVDVLFDGRPFTSYRWEERLKRPVLFPLRTATGALVTRGWPIEPRPDEPTDHPHHIGLWLAYGDVNGVDFWGHSEKNSSPRKGVIVHRGVKLLRDGVGRGELVTNADWVLPGDVIAFAETTHHTFSGGANRRVVDWQTTLTAQSGDVRLPDNKEGFFGLRLARELEHPGAKNPAATGSYRSSEGIVGEAVWGTRGRWLMLNATVAGAPVTIAFLDHPQNPGHPTHWHARPWGLMAANTLGQKALSKGKNTLDFALAKGAAATFRYRVLILSKAATPADIEAEYQSFVAAPAR